MSDDEARAKANEMYADDDCEIDADARVIRIVGDAVWVAAWVRVPEEKK